MRQSAVAIEKLHHAARLRRAGGIGGAMKSDALECEAQAILKPPSR
jgi:hypothetical protein